MSEDPWVLNDTLHPALERMGLPEWQADEPLRGLLPHMRWRLGRSRGKWQREYRCYEYGGEEEWYPQRGLTPHEAAALIEKDLREKLWAKGRIALCPDAFGGIRRWFVFQYGQYGMSRWLGEDGKWHLASEVKMNVARAWFIDHPAALQAACMAMKGKSSAANVSEH